MNYKIGDKVVFIFDPLKIYAWKLDNYGIYEIENIAYGSSDFDDYKKGEFYYSVKNKSCTTSWFEYDDFLPLKKYRKLKLKKLNDRNKSNR